MIDSELWISTWNSRDDDAIAALCTEDVEVQAVVLGVEPRFYRGPEGVRQWLQEVRQRFHADSRVERVTPIDEETMMLEGTLAFDERARGMLDGQPFVLLVRLRDGKARWIGTFMNADEARDAFARGVV
jgi:ketosteroid isomerase-like protein